MKDYELKEIPNFNGYYISNDGCVYGAFKPGTRDQEDLLHEIKPRLAKNGYTRVYLREDSTHKRKDLYIHRLVAQAFIDNPRNCNVVNHKDCNRSNNDVNNLEWCTIKENTDYSMKMGHVIRNNLGQYKSTPKPALVFQVLNFQDQ